MSGKHTRWPSDQAERFPTVCPVSGLPIRVAPHWFYRNPRGSYVTSFAQIGRSIIMVVAKGYVEEEDMQHAIALAERIKGEVFAAGDRYVSIENFTGARGGAVAARRRYLAYTNQLEGLLGSFVFGLPPFFRLSFNLSRQLGLHRHKVQVVKDYAAAIRAAVSLTAGAPAPVPDKDAADKLQTQDWPLVAPPDTDRRLSQPLPLHPVPFEEVCREEVNHLLEFLGGIDPEQPGILRRRRVDVSPSSPLEPVYEAIELMKRDMDYLVEEQRQTLEALSLRRDELRRKSTDLEHQNTNLRQLLQQNVADSREMETGVVRNAHSILKPLIEAMRQNRPNADQRLWLERLDSQVDELLNSFAPHLESLRFNLTPQELRVARLIREGYSSQQIARRQQISTRTVTTHRTQIRRKLGIRGRHRNLRTCLLAIPDGRFDRRSPS